MARHLLKPRDNDHVNAHMVDGIMAQDLFGAFAEATGTRCQKYLFSLSLDPPPSAVQPHFHGPLLCRVSGMGGHNGRELGVKNGMLGTAVEASDGNVSVDLDGDVPRRLSFDPQTYRSVDHGYAVTIRKSQGATVDQAYVVASRTMDEHLAYVAMTRHRDEMRLYVSDENRPKWAAHLLQDKAPEQMRNCSDPSIG